MKPGRQSVILEIISSQDIETQFDLMNALAERGVKSTQATLSRDIKDMNLIKQMGPNGKQRYVRSPESEVKAANSKLITILKESVLQCAKAQNIVVLKTLPGLASAACSAIDKMDIEGLVGTLAGDDTAFIAMSDNNYADAFLKQLKEIYK